MDSAAAPDDSEASAPREASSVEAVLRREALAELPRVALGIATFLLLLATLSWLGMPRPLAWAFSLTALASAAAVLFLRRGVMTGRVSEEQAHSAATATVGLLVANGVFRWVGSGQFLQLGLVAFAMLLAGMLLLSRRWLTVLAAAVAGAIATGALLALRPVGSDGLVLLAGSTALALAAQRWRRDLLLQADALRQSARMRQRRLEVALQAAHEGEWKFRGIFDRVQDVYYRARLDGTLEMVSPSVRKYGYDPAGLTGGPVSRVFADPREPARIQERLLSEWEVRDHEVRLRRADGSDVVASLSGALVRDEQGRPAGIEGFARDITERIRNQDELERARREAETASRAKSEFLATVSHEIRTPLNAILGLADMLLDSDLPQAAREDAELLRRSGETLLGLINDVLDFSRIDAGRLELEEVTFVPARVASDVADPLRPMATNKSLELCVRVGAGLEERAVGDVRRLRQVLLNLTGNAIKFTEKGRIVIGAEALPGRGDGERWVRFQVVDTGPGIPVAALERVFEPFTQGDASTTRRHGGSGLGLTIARRLVEAMGGEIGLASVEGRGTNVWFEVPLRRAPQPGEGSVIPAAPASPSARARILVVEDNPVNQRIVEAVLEKLGHAVAVAENGKEALEALDRASYELILMDCQMPEMDGYEATRSIREREGRDALPRIPIIAMTANAMDGDRERCLAAGMDDYLAKPVRAADLGAAVARNLARRPQPAAMDSTAGLAGEV